MYIYIYIYIYVTYKAFFNVFRPCTEGVDYICANVHVWYVCLLDVYIYIYIQFSRPR